ncbi:MAG: Uma2 family endonuclease [Acidimicrobiaceae bacterium]|nr:Uma2 family endonuclease [Acidimicrobiaceae bacterium]
MPPGGGAAEGRLGLRAGLRVDRSGWMMSAQETLAGTPQALETFVFPDPPEDPDDKMTMFDHLTITGAAHYLAVHLGDPETTLVAGEHYMALAPTLSMAGVRYPDLLVAFDADREGYRRRNAYVISEQGKAPEFVLEVVSPSSGRRDRVDKPQDYARLGVGEYWWFDGQGRTPRQRLAGHRLVDGRYEPLDVEALADGSLQGLSPVLGVGLRWADGELVFYDPDTGDPIATLESERQAREAAEAARHVAEAARHVAEARAEAAEARLRELEEAE